MNITAILNRLKERAHAERGFTLIELLIVVTVIGIITAIAIPTYGTIQAQSREKAVEEAAVRSLTAASAQHAQGREVARTATEMTNDDIQVDVTRTGNDICATASWRDASKNVPTASRGKCAPAEVLAPIITGCTVEHRGSAGTRFTIQWHSPTAMRAYTTDDMIWSALYPHTGDSYFALGKRAIAADFLAVRINTTGTTEAATTTIEGVGLSRGRVGKLALAYAEPNASYAFSPESHIEFAFPILPGGGTCNIVNN